MRVACPKCGQEVHVDDDGIGAERRVEGLSVDRCEHLRVLKAAGMRRGRTKCGWLTLAILDEEMRRQKSAHPALYF